MLLEVSEEGDHIGGFACTAGVGVDKLKKEYEASGEVPSPACQDACVTR